MHFKLFGMDGFQAVQSPAEERRLVGICCHLLLFTKLSTEFMLSLQVAMVWIL